MCQSANQLLLTLSLWAAGWVAGVTVWLSLWALLGRYRQAGWPEYKQRGWRRVRFAFELWWEYDMDWIRP
jgi:hypothetical protein